ncbi:MAG: sugar phosphate isomerase/epimerase [Defluviitaleaceae bacterium]|nr:sugar phosphate isomerase/epimerase [Defluviitaleaceae bacterium]
MKGIGVLPVFIPDLSAEEKYRLIKDVGFDAVSIYWGDENKYEQLSVAKGLGLTIDNIHSQNDNANEIWMEGIEGENRQSVLMSCINDCATHHIPAVVIHLTGFPPYPPVSDLGLKRIEELVRLAEQKNVKLAFENLWTFEHLDEVFERFSSPNVGFCYDIGHENLNPHKDCLVSYGDRIFALHINDNFADGYDAHVLPFDGLINWDKKMSQLKQYKNVDFLTVEIYRLDSGEHKKSCIYKNISAEEFLKLAYKKAVKLSKI